MKRQIFETEIEGKNLVLEISELGDQANAAVLGKYGETVVLATVVMAKNDQNSNFFPLTVDYEERFYAAGKIIGSRFIRREGRPSDEAIVSARLIDRTIRPLFDQRIRRPIQVVLTVLAYDGENDPDLISLMAVSTALSISDIPWNGPVAGVKVVRQQPNLVEAFFAGTETEINMIELGAEEVSQESLLDFFETSQEKIKKLIDFQKEIIKKIGKPKIKFNLSQPPEEIKEKILDFLAGRLEGALYQPLKNERLNSLTELKSEAQKEVGMEPENWRWLDEIFEGEIERILDKKILEKEQRPDGRKLDELRPLYAEAGLFKRTHGSALFVRGETQALSVTTLAAPGAEQLIETMEFSGKKHFMHHYNFPPFCVGEVGVFRMPGRREIGHGLLAEKALRYLIPSIENFPYTIRVVSEILSSNGSSSMASVCAACLSLMDAGVPIKNPVAGIAMGLISGNGQTAGANEQYKILTDIQGPEDHHGDMDFKVAGTGAGFTAIQMDVKINGINKEIFEKTLIQAKKAHQQILELMSKTLDKPRPELSPFAPAVLTFEIKTEKIGMVIGPGGRMIQSIIQMSGGETTIDIEEDGKIFISAPDKKQAEFALEQIKNLVKEYKVGDVVEGEVTKILEFGAIVDLGSGHDGMIHISELKNGFVKKVEEVVGLGDRVKAKVIRVDPDGRIGLSLK